MLRKLRVIAAICVLTALTAFFLDFSGTVPRAFSFLAKLQLLPALTGALGGLAVSACILVILIFLAILFGRVYCSCLCPLGIMQDVITHLGALFRPAGKKKTYKYSRPFTKTRLSFLFFTCLAVALGALGVVRLSVITGLLDPYADYGRIVTHLLYPIYACGNNLLVSAARHFGSFKFYLVPHHIQSLFAFVTAMVSLVIIAYLAVRHGRLYCNAVCPVGTFLGFLARRSVLKVRIDREKCIGCRLCASNCKSSCIDIDQKRIDNDRCVVCLDCLSVCKKDAIHYAFGSGKTVQSLKTQSKAETHSGSAPDISKRQFLAGSVGAVLTGSLCGFVEKITAKETELTAEKKTIGGLPISENGKIPYKTDCAVSPPGAISINHLAARCTSCHLCIAQCPQRVIKPAFLDYGLGGIMLPVMKFSTEVFCNYDCTICGDVCPTGALIPLALDEKHLTQIGHVVFIKENCVVFTEETNCGACAEHCPTQAVRMVDYKGNLTIPETREQYCVGCGACESICPVVPYKAIHVEGNKFHKQAQLPPQEEKVEAKMDDFGF